jgi:hypothetical protein
MPHQLHWRELKGGIIAVVVLSVIILAVLTFARVGALHGKKVTLYVITDEAPGVLSGTEVWVSGERDGQVTDISFRPPTTDTLERLLLKTEVLKKALPHIRRNSYAQIRAGGTLIGTPIIYISAGTSDAPGLKDGDTVRARPLAGMGAVAEGIAHLTPEVRGLASSAKDVVSKTKRPVGTIGNYRAGGLPDLSDVTAGISSLNSRARGTGSLTRLARADLKVRAAKTMAEVDSIRRLVSSSKGSVGRFRKDSTLATKAGQVMAEIDSLRLLVSSPLGTIAAVHSDSVLARKLDEQHELMAALIRDIKSNPMRYIQF